MASTFLDSSWQIAGTALVIFTTRLDFQLATIGTFIIHESVFFLSGLPSIVFERTGLFSKYKIQSKNNSPAAQERCIWRLVIYHFCVNLPVIIVSYPAFKYMGLRSSLPLPSWNVIFTQIFFYFILEDFVFYWGHRVLHTKWLYKNVHSVHHEYATPFGLTSEYAHPAEILFLGFATVIGPALTGPHLFTLWLWVVLRVLETVEAHSGYHFPWSPSNFLPLYGVLIFMIIIIACFTRSLEIMHRLLCIWTGCLAQIKVTASLKHYRRKWAKIDKRKLGLFLTPQAEAG